MQSAGRGTCAGQGAPTAARGYSAQRWVSGGTGSGCRRQMSSLHSCWHLAKPCPWPARVPHIPPALPLGGPPCVPPLSRDGQTLPTAESQRAGDVNARGNSPCEGSAPGNLVFRPGGVRFHLKLPTPNAVGSAHGRQRPVLGRGAALLSAVPGVLTLRRVTGPPPRGRADAEGGRPRCPDLADVTPRRDQDFPLVPTLSALHRGTPTGKAALQLSEDAAQRPGGPLVKELSLQGDTIFVQKQQT